MYYVNFRKNSIVANHIRADMILYTLLSSIGIIYLGFLIWKRLKKIKQQYHIPSIIFKWVFDDLDGDLYEAFITSDQKVWVCYGRYAHSSGSSSTTWSAFAKGDLNELVLKTMGQNVLEEILEFIKQHK